MEKGMNKKLIYDVILIILIAIMISSIFWIISVIKTEGGKCTASPLDYSMMKLKEKTGLDYDCVCTYNPYDPLKRALNLSFNLVAGSPIPQGGG